MDKKVILLSALRIFSFGIPLASMIFLTNFVSFLLVGIIHMFFKGSVIYSEFYYDHLVETGQSKKAAEIDNILKRAGPEAHLIAALIAGVLFGAVLYFIKSFF